MAHKINRLSSLSINRLNKTGRHADGGGLYLSISKNGGRRWVFIFRWQGKYREMGFGSAKFVSLKEARDKAAEARKLVQEGANPIDNRTRAKGAFVTFGDYAEKYIQENKASWKNDKHVKQWSATIETYCKPILHLPVEAIDTDHILAILRPIWQEKNETASRLRGRIERVLAAAKVEGLRSGENPAQWRNHLDNVLPKRRKLSRGHHTALDYKSLPQFMTRLQDQVGLGAIALQLTILTAARTSEILNAQWSEFNLEERMWTIPAIRMKAGRPHRVPLSTQATQLLSDLKQEANSDLLFEGQKAGRPLSNMTMTQLLRRMKVDATVHGFRSSFRDWAAECTNHPNEVCELALARTIKNLAEAAYRRGDLFDKRSALMQDWAEYCFPE